MATSPDLSPLELDQQGNHLRFLLKRQEEIYLELPANYEHLLAKELELLLAHAGELTAQIDLGHAPGLSSRQLGSLIALQKVLRPYFKRVPVVGVSDGVRHLLELTKTDQFFDVE